MKPVLRKLIFFVVWYLGYYTLCFLLFAPELFTISIYLVLMVSYYVVSFVDTMIRPFAEKAELSPKYSLILLMVFLVNPFLIVLTVYENINVISKYVEVWDHILISYIGIITFLVGGFITIVSRVQLGMYGSGRLVIEENHKLVSTGIYRYLRHPMYFGGLLGVIGMALGIRSIIMLFVSGIFYFVIFRNRIREEERLLIEEFGESYNTYMKQTKRLIPRVY